MHAMIDLETLNVGIAAPLFEIGICIFDMEQKEIISSQQWNVDLLDVILTTGFCPNPETIKWWQDQSYDPRSMPRQSLRDSLLEVTDYLRIQKVDKVWANSPSFDCILMQRHFEACKLLVPWKYSQELDFRTMRWLYKRFDLDLEDQTVVSHNAMEDAIGQTKMLIQMMKGISSVQLL